MSRLLALRITWGKVCVRTKARKRKSDLTTYFRLGGVSPSGPDSKFTLVPFNVFSYAHVAGLEKKEKVTLRENKLHKMLSSHHHLHFILIFGLSIRVFDLLRENHVELEQKHPSLPALSDKLLWIPDVEGVLEDDVTKVVNTNITAVKHREMKCVICLEH